MFTEQEVAFIEATQEVLVLGEELRLLEERFGAATEHTQQVAQDIPRGSDTLERRRVLTNEAAERAGFSEGSYVRNTLDEAYAEVEAAYELARQAQLNELNSDHPSV